MKLEAIAEQDVAPAFAPGVELAVMNLEAALRRVLGPDTCYVLVMAQNATDMVNVQATTNAPPALAQQLLGAALVRGFDSLN
jgi:hypothetical protein